MQTAQAQAGLNQSTATTQQLLNMTDQVNPWGSVSYTQDGETGFTDSNGRWVSVPKFTQTTTYNPEQQAIFDKTTAAQGNIAGIAQDQSAKLGRYLDDPFQFNNQDAANWAYDLAQERIAPQQKEAQKALETRLINSGLRPGTAAWDSEMRRMTMANNDQNNQLALTGRGQAFGEALSTRNQPINEITALLSGSQVSNPGAVSSPTPQAQVGGVDYTGLVSENYKTQAANSGGIMGGLFGLAGSLGSAGIKAGMFSDIRLKTDIQRVGTLDNGLPIYSYRYKAGGPMQIGVMAQEVAQIRPEAVMIDNDSGFLMVDYGKAAH